VGQTTKYAVYFPVQIGDTFWSISIASAEEDVLSDLIAFRNKLTLGIGALFICGIVFSTLGARAWFIVKEEEKRKRVEKQLRESEERLNLAVDSASTGLWSIDVESQQIWATDRTLDMYGFASGELVDVEKFLAVVHVEDRERVKNLLEHTLRNKSILQDEYRITLADGTVRWMAVRGGYSQTSGMVATLAGASIDITERKQAEQALQGERAFSEALLESLPGLFYLYTFPEMRLVRWNRNHETDTGYGPEELRNRYALDWYAPADQQAVAEGIKKVIDLGRFKIESNLIMKDGRSVPYLLTGARFQHFDQSFCMGLGMDITELKHMEQSLRDSEQNLRSLTGRLISAQEEERSRIARELHDDITQRLAVLAIEMGKLELHFDSDPHRNKQMLGTIKNSIVKLSEDIHAISRQLHPSILDDLGLVRAIQSQCAAFSKRNGIEVTFRHEDVPEDIPKNISFTLYRIIQEGLRNIARHSQASSAYIFIHCSDKIIHLSIGDMGIGYEQEQVKNKVGLGLVSMEERVKLVRGVITIDSVPGEGTVIDVQVPLEIKVGES
jgi:PAS domain S-box-containing protein